MSIRYLADADLNQNILRGLRRREPSLDILSAEEAAVIGLPDPVVLRVAADVQRILVSHDRRTMPRHLQQFIVDAESPGVTIAPRSLEITVAIEDLLIIWSASDAAKWRNRVAYLPI